MRPILALILVFFACCKSVDSARSATPPAGAAKASVVTNGYRVTKIDSLKSVYLVYARRNDTLFKIVSDKNQLTNCNKIKAGRQYRFKLRSLYFTDLTPEEKAHSIPLATVGNLHSAGIDWDGKGTIIKLEGDSVRDIYYAKNLSGLCFQQ